MCANTPIFDNEKSPELPARPAALVLVFAWWAPGLRAEVLFKGCTNKMDNHMVSAVPRAVGELY